MPLSAKLSIFHRITGLVLSAGAVVLVNWLFALAYRSDTAVLMQAFFASTAGKVTLIGFTFVFFYHFLNGIRHLFWDIGKGLELETVNKSGIAVLILAVVVTALVWVLGA